MYQLSTLAPRDDLRFAMDWTEAELFKVAREFIMQDQIQLAEKVAPPTRPRDGMLVFADGTSWNPGGGRGFYGYYSGTWNKL